MLSLGNLIDNSNVKQKFVSRHLASPHTHYWAFSALLLFPPLPHFVIIPRLFPASLSIFCFPFATAPFSPCYHKLQVCVSNPCPQSHTDCPGLARSTSYPVESVRARLLYPWYHPSHHPTTREGATAAAYGLLAPLPSPIRVLSCRSSSKRRGEGAPSHHPREARRPRQSPRAAGPKHSMAS